MLFSCTRIRKTKNRIFQTPPTGGGTAASCLVSPSLSEGILVECELHLRDVVHYYALYHTGGGGPRFAECVCESESENMRVASLELSSLGEIPWEEHQR